MNQEVIFWPLLAQVLLTFVVYGVLAVRRYGAIRSGQAKAREFKVRGAEPPSSATAAANLANQFELPVLFYVACMALYATKGAGFATVLLAWTFVVTRTLHACVHLTGNNLFWRSRLFQLSVAVTVGLWAFFALHLYGAY